MSETSKFVQVWNKNTVDHREQFMGKEIAIPAGQWIKMGRSEAIKFKGQYFAMKRDGQGRQTVDSMKIIEIVPIVGSGQEKQKFVCMKDGTEHATQAALDAYIAENFSEEIQDQEFAKDFVKKNKKTKSA